MGKVIDYTDARRARGLPPTPLEAAELRDMARQEVQWARESLPESIYRYLLDDDSDD